MDGSKFFVRKTDFDAIGRVSRETYPSGYTIISKYDKYSYLTGVTDGNNQNIWQAVESNAKGQLTRTQSGAKETVFGFDSRGFTTSIVTAGISNWSYVFDSKANLASRTDGITNYKDSLTYDSMNRLTAWKVYQGSALQQTNSMVYDATTGLISSKTDLNSYAMSYGENGKPHALTSISGAPGIISATNQTIAYTDFKKVKQITEGNNVLDISYGTDEQRIKTVLATTSGTLTRYYMGDYEEEVRNGTVRKIHYICGGNGLAAIAVQNAGQDTLYYVHTDYQGSLIALSLPDGTVKERYAYDPWGNRRNPANWTQRDTRTAFLFNRGYTMHEHLPEFNLINMNGRVYDPLTSMFLSPDPYVQSPDDWLNYNRYGYCLNNPLVYVDPTGENPLLIVAIIIGAYLGGSSVNNDFNPVHWNYNSWQTYAGIGVGALSGWAGAGIGANVAASAIAGGSSTIGAGVSGGMVGGMVSGGINGAGMTAIMGGNFDDIMGNMTMGSVMGGFGGALSGGVGAAIGDFSGVSGSAFKNGMYELGHSALKGAATGLAGGAMMAAMKQDASYLWKGAATGAALSVGMAGLRILSMGPTFIPDPEKYGTSKGYNIVYRSGSIFMQKSTGITLGNNISVKLTGNLDYDRYLLQHETGHISQINGYGTAKFYLRTAREYLKYGLGNVYSEPGTLEYGADLYSFRHLGYYYNNAGIRYSFP